MGDNIGYAYNSTRVNFVFKVRQFMSHFNDIFSKFNKFIAPAYHHDRCERSVQMKLYSMHKRELVLTFLTFFITIGLGILVGLIGPPITRIVEQKGTNLLPNSSKSLLTKGPFFMKSPAVTTYSQQLWVIAKFNISHKEDKYFQKPFQVRLSVNGIAKDNQKEDVLTLRGIHTSNQTLTCDKQSCTEFPVLHLGFLEYTQYILNISFIGLGSISNQWSTVEDVIFYFKTYNPSFTKLQIWIRFIFVLLSFLFASWFAHSLRKYPVSDWALEQKWISVLLPLLLLYNDPFYPMIFLMDSWIPMFLDTTFESSFLCALLLFWLCIYHGLRQNDRNWIHFYLPKVGIVGWMWLCAVVMATMQKYDELNDPLYSMDSETNHFYNFKLFFFAGATLYVLYLVYLIITAYSELRAMPYFDVRLRFVTLLMSAVLCTSLILTYLRFGVTALEDNFVSELSTTYTSSAEFMAFYSLLNIYVFTSAYVYSSADKVLLDTQIMKDNPAFSMTNDSDEEVHFGCDDEARRPLRAENNDDSD